MTFTVKLLSAFTEERPLWEAEWPNEGMASVLVVHVRVWARCVGIWRAPLSCYRFNASHIQMTTPSDRMPHPS